MHELRQSLLAVGPGVEALHEAASGHCCCMRVSIISDDAYERNCACPAHWSSNQVDSPYSLDWFYQVRLPLSLVPDMLVRVVYAG